MIITFFAVLVFYLLANFPHFIELREIREERGFWAAFNFSLAVVVHQIARGLIAIIVFVFGIFGIKLQ